MILCKQLRKPKLRASVSIPLPETLNSKFKKALLDSGLQFQENVKWEDIKLPKQVGV